MKRSFFLTLVLFLAIINIAAACTAFQPAERPSEPIRVAFTQRWGDYTLLVAQEKGLFEKYGVDVEPIYYEVVADTHPDLAAGQIDAALIAAGDIINVDHSADMKVVAISDDGGAGSIVVNAEIITIQDLKGKTIGVLVGTQYQLMISEMLQSAGLSIDDVIIVDVNPKDAALALRTNRVQAVYTWEPFLTQAISEGNQEIYPKETLRLFPNMVVVNESLAEQRPADIRAFLQAWFEAVEVRLQNPQETQMIAAKYLGVDIEKVQPDGNLKILTLVDNKAFFNIQNENSVYAIAKITSDYLISIGSVAQQIDPLELLDPSFLPEN